MSYQLIKNKEEFISYMEGVKDLLVFDTETTGLKIDSQLLGISLYDGLRPPCFIPTDYFFTDGLYIGDIKRVACQYFPNVKIGIAHNGKFDLGVFKSNGIPDIELMWDTASMIHIYNPDLLKQLETRIKEDFGYAKPTFKSIIGKNWDKIDWVKDVKSGTITLNQLAKYACEDVFYTFKLYEKYRALLEQDDLLKIHDKIEIPVIKVLRDMFVRGVAIDVPLLQSMGSQVDGHLTRITNNIYNEAGCVFNLNSPKQKADILFNKLKLSSSKTTKSGAASTDAFVLEELAAKGYPIAGYMVEYSELQKLNSGYIQAIPDRVDFDGRLRADFNSNGTKTGRFSSANPNLQNQPNNDAFPIRAAFVPKPGYKLICADYSQIELRVMGHVSKDKKFMQAFWDGQDIHGKVANDLGIDRKQAKVVNFGVLYGMGPQKLALTLGISENEAKSIVKGYETTYDGYRTWKQQTEKFAEKHGYIRNLFGRIRRLPGAMSSDKKLFYGSLRQACNTVVQGSSADLIKLAMIQLHKKFLERGFDEGILLQVHDELVCEVPDSTAEEALHIMERTMAETVKLSVPLEVDGRILTNWAEMKAKEYNNPLLLKPNHLDLLQLWQML